MLAYIFPGQGAQYLGMGKDLYDNFPSSKKVFQKANGILGFKISELCFNGPQDKLTLTENAQPAILTVSIAALEALKEHVNLEPKFTPLHPKNPNLSNGDKRHIILKPAANSQLLGLGVTGFTAGLSLGEYTALAAAEVLSFEDTVYLVRKRGQYMQEAAENNPGKMLSIIGLAEGLVSEICSGTGCEIANLNCPGQFVVSGTNSQIDEVSILAREKGAKQVIPLEVSGAFHCSLMKEAEIKLAGEIEKLKFNPPAIPVVSNVTAGAALDTDEIKANLIKQVSSTTYWEKSIRFMISQGVDCFLELGPGTVLRSLNRRIDPNVKTINLSNYEQIKSFNLDNAGTSKTN